MKSSFNSVFFKHLQHQHCYNVSRFHYNQCVRELTVLLFGDAVLLVLEKRSEVVTWCEELVTLGPNHFRYSLVYKLKESLLVL